MLARNSEKLLHQLFEISVVLKGVYGLIEASLGFYIVFIDRRFVSNFLLLLVANELAEDPHDWFAVHVADFSHHLTDATQAFTGTYFLAYGLIKLGLCVSLLMNKSWAYPAALFFMTGFMGYHVYRVFHTHSLILFLVILTDIATIWLVWHEWRHPRSIQAS